LGGMPPDPLNGACYACLDVSACHTISPIDYQWMETPFEKSWIRPWKVTPFFISYIKPHKPVTTQYPAHWVKDLLKEAEVNTKSFQSILSERSNYCSCKDSKLVTFSAPLTGARSLL